MRVMVFYYDGCSNILKITKSVTEYYHPDSIKLIKFEDFLKDTKLQMFVTYNVEHYDIFVDTTEQRHIRRAIRFLSRKPGYNFPKMNFIRYSKIRGGLNRRQWLKCESDSLKSIQNKLYNSLGLSPSSFDTHMTATANHIQLTHEWLYRRMVNGKGGNFNE